MMPITRAIRIAENWSQGHVCTLREGEAQEYHKLCLAALREQEQLADWLEELLQYKDMKEQGLLEVLPCKIGSDAWFVHDKGIDHIKVKEFFAYTREKYVSVTSYITQKSYDLSVEDFGQTWFISYEKAKRKFDNPEKQEVL